MQIFTPLEQGAMDRSKPGRGYDQFLEHAPLLSRISDADAGTLARRGTKRAWKAGATIFREGDPGDGLAIVIDGRVRIWMVSEDGQEMTLSCLGPGDCLGDLAVLDGRPRSASATAVEPTTMFVVTRDASLAWLMERPAAAIALLETMSLRLRRADEALANLSFLDLSHRLARKLLRLAAETDTAGTGPRVVVTQAELGGMVGVSRESVNKQLREFERDGLVELGRGSVTLLDVARLRTLP